MDFENEGKAQRQAEAEAEAPSIEVSAVEDEYDKRTKRTKKITKIISTTLSILLLIFVIALFFRICQADHKELKDLYLTEGFKQAYEISNDFRTHVAGTEFSENGALYAYTFVYNEKAQYMQLTVRYNTRHIDEVIDAINENEKKLHGNTAAEYTRDDIRVYYTITDSNGRLYSESDIKVLEVSEKYNYVYTKLEISGIDFNVNALTINMMLENVEKIELDGKATLVYSKGKSTSAGSMLEFHSKDDTYIPYEFSRKEKKELGIK